MLTRSTVMPSALALKLSASRWHRFMKARGLKVEGALSLGMITIILNRDEFNISSNEGKELISRGLQEQHMAKSLCLQCVQIVTIGEI